MRHWLGNGKARLTCLAVRRSAGENLSVAKLAKSFGSRPKVSATSATVGMISSAARLTTLLATLWFVTGCERRQTDGPSPQPTAPDQTPQGQVRSGGLPREITMAGGVEMVLVPAGEFLMGGDAETDSQPLHKVDVSEFYMDKYEVTQELYQRIIGSNPSRRTGSANPVERVRWSDTLKFCNARSLADGLKPCYDLATRTCDFNADGYRLPTEAEWEYACRAGTEGDYYFSGGAELLDTYGWFKGNARRKHHPVGQKNPNAFGLYDMAGNVREWCNDWYAVDYYAKSPAADPRGPAKGDKAVLRGGAFSGSADTCTSWARYCDEPGFTDACVASDDYGFRCVRAATPAVATEVDGKPQDTPRPQPE